MANNFKTNPVYMDDFSVAINLCTSLGYSAGTPIRVKSIEWVNPTNVGDLCLVTDKASGTPIFTETCDVAKKNVVKYFRRGTWVPNLYIAISGVATGALIVTLG